MDYIIKTFRFILSHKWKILATILFTALFLFILFPFKDLNDFVSSQVLALTQNKVYLQFGDMHINPVTTTLSMDNVSVETPDIDNLNLQSLSATPSIVALFKKQPGGKITAEGLFGGNFEAKLTPLEKLESGALKANVEVMAEKISLKELRSTIKLSIPMTGSANLNAKVTADLSFKEQPDGEVSAVIDNFEMPSTALNLQDMGSVNLPEIKFKQIEIKGKLANGKFVIDSAKLGNPSDDFSGTLKGDITLRIESVNGQITPVMNGYNLTLDLAAKQAFKDRAQFFLSFIDQFKHDETGLSRYKFKLQASGAGMPPQMSPIN